VGSSRGLDGLCLEVRNKLPSIAIRKVRRGMGSRGGARGERENNVEGRLTNNECLRDRGEKGQSRKLGEENDAGLMGMRVLGPLKTESQKPEIQRRNRGRAASDGERVGRKGDGASGESSNGYKDFILNRRIRVESTGWRRQPCKAGDRTRGKKKFWAL